MTAMLTPRESRIPAKKTIADVMIVYLVTVVSVKTEIYR
jgi:hypothetical protein